MSEVTDVTDDPRQTPADPGIRSDAPEGITAPAQSYQREDTRWETANPLRDWLILIVVAALHTAWMLVVFFFEPGIR